MKFSIRQILASTAGAVCAALIASVFGVKGTIVGVAIGSAAATMATAFVAQSIDRGHQVVKQVAVRAPDSSTLLRRLGGTGPSGAAASSVDPDESSAPTEVVGQSGPQGARAPETIEMASSAAPAADTERLEISATTETPATQRLQATSTPARATAARRTPQGFSWRAIAGTVAIVFVLALLFITAIELISGKPLSTIFGGADTGTSVRNFVNPSPAPPATPTSTTSTTGASDLHHDDERSDDHDEHHGAEGKRDDNHAANRVDDDHHFGSGPRAGRPRRRRRPHEGPGRRYQPYQPLNSAGRRSTKLAMPSLESSVFVTSSWPMASS